MNYIQSLLAMNNEKANKIKKLEDGINELLAYVNSDKFTKGNDSLLNYVNINDIVLRLNEIKGTL